LDASHLQKVIKISLADALTLLDGLIKLRLSECWLVGFVVSSSTVAIHVDNDVALELAAEVHRKPDHLGHRFRIFAIYVEDRNLEHLGHVGGVGCAAGFTGAGGEADLV